MFNMNYIISGVVSALYTLVVSCACVYLSIPILVKFLPAIVLQGTFLNLVCSPRRVSRLHKPKEAWKLDGVEHHFVQSNSGKLGVWHIYPISENTNSQGSKSQQNDSLSKANRVILYCHGNAWHRSFGHRRSLYVLLRGQGFHVIAFDYRGYGDSDGWPSEQGVVEDTLTVYKWVVDQLTEPDCQIFVWGHSLGTAIATQAVYKVENADYAKVPTGLILEAPFTCAVDAITEYPLSKNIVKIYPGRMMEKIFRKALLSTKTSFSTVNTLPKLNNNVLILHAQDDKKVHFKLGKKLFDETKKTQDSPLTVTFASFKASHGLGHNGIWQHPELLSLVESWSQGIVKNKFVEIEL